MSSPHTRAQRTRSSPSAHRSALTRYPLGELVNSRASVLAGLGAALAIGLVVACTTKGAQRQAQSKAVVNVAAISPAAGADLAESSVVDATLEYRISDFVSEADRYYLTIQFDKVGGGSFNHYRRFADEPQLSADHGSIRVTYPLKAIWNDQRLKRPITVRFLVVERTGAHDSIAIGQAGPVEYGPQ